MNWLHDTRTDCWSVMLTLSVEEYISLVKEAHSDRGGILGQRDVLKTTTAKRIRQRMVSDICQGAVLPPVVIGAVVDADHFDKLPLPNAAKARQVLPDAPPPLSIIDGMQRTAALREAASEQDDVLRRQIRVEFWLARSVRSLVYRMLVLNTGQVPWTLSRQLAVVYDPLLKEIRDAVPEIEKITTADNPGRRVAPAQYAADDLVELYIAFSLRKITIDTKEALSEEFSRLDFVENLSDAAFQTQFYDALRLLASLDRAVSRFDSGEGGRYAKGRAVFDGQPARIGFIVALAQHALGRPGQDRSPGDRKARMTSVQEGAMAFIEKLNVMSHPQLREFLQLNILEEILDRRVGQVGRYERAVFFEAFKVLIEDGFSVADMEQCWRAN